MRVKKQPTLPVINFLIDHLDPFGQGVHKDGKTITFIQGVLPGETGTAKVYKRSKGVQFALLDTLEKSASERITPACPHFDQCPGCQYQHTSYENELGYKQAALLRHLSDVGAEQLAVHAAPSRLAYRNRIQLHYRHKYIGMLDGARDKVVEVPHCKIIREELKEKFDELYLQEDWRETHSGRGHCEIYLNDGEVKLNWNTSYAEGGFSQVNAEMNEHLKDILQTTFSDKKIDTVLDLFSGAGNLSEDLAVKRRVLVDSYRSDKLKADNFLSLDLFSDEALSTFSKKFKKEKFDALLIDPPRKGFANLDLWIRRIKPKYLFYVSCNPASLARDLKNLSQRHKIEQVHLLDFFPATSHFETFVSLKFK
ncbi:MAG: 23S rRNA (uracil1939-C5)-methyltransferase [Candidatus Azotimanducaceae bacterium]